MIGIYTITEIVDMMLSIENASSQFVRPNRVGSDIPDMVADIAKAMSPVVYSAYMAKSYGNKVTDDFIINREVEPGYSMVNQ